MIQWKKIVATAMSMALLVPANFACRTIDANAASEDNLSVYGGWNESLYAEWDENDAGDAVVSYKLSSDSTYKTVDKEDAELIRQEDTDTARVDIPGLKAGSYDLNITSSEGKVYTASDIEVKENDRSGYAHFNYTRGVGAYNDDGTLKDNAIVIYVTDENKDTIKVPGYESYATGIGNILNGNIKLMEKIVADGHALDIRFVGTVEAPDGLTGYNSTENGGTVGDNGNMAIIKMSKDITLEGIGTDALIHGWGFSFYVGQDYTNRESYEVRNLTFKDSPEDALGFQGFMGDSKTLTTPIEHAWVHNNSFYPGYCAKPAESDKAEGDGSCDFKRGKNYTMDYNYYYGCHKTNLVGASDSNLQFNMTFHHNYYEDCQSRGPLARQANIHIYNTYFKGNTAKTVDARANAYILSEANYYDSCKNPMLTQSGAVVKSYNDIVYNCMEDNTATVVKDRAEKVSNNNKYSDFDTNPSIFYYDSENEKSDVTYITSAAQAKADCIAFSGVMKSHDKIVNKVDASSIIENEPEEAVTLPYSINFTDKDSADYAGTKMVQAGISQLDPNKAVSLENVVLKTSSKYNTTATTFKLRSQGITFKVDEESKITLTEPADAGKYALAIYNENGENIFNVENGTDSLTLDAGTYTIQSANAEKDAYISKLSIESADGSKVDSSDEEIKDTTVIPETPEDSTVAEPTEEIKDDSEDTTNSSDNDKTEEPVEDVTNEESNSVKMGTYELNDSVIKEDSSNYANMIFNCRDVISSCVKLRSSNSIKFTLDRDAEVTINTEGNGVILSTDDGSIVFDNTTSKKASVKNAGSLKFTLSAGTYTISGYTSSKNTNISSITFAEV